MAKNKKIKLLILLTLSALTSIAQCDGDTINPWFVDFQYELTISCSDYVNTAMPQVDDDCDEDVEILMLEDVVPGSCGNEQTVYRLYRAFDDSGNGAVEMQTIHVVDETPPVFGKMVNATISCGESVVFAEPVAIDNCSEVYVTNFDITESVDDCSSSYTRVWTAVDGCGNTSTTQQVITVADLEPPTIVGDIYIALQQGMSLDENYIVALDNCSEVEVTYVDAEVSGNNVIRTYTAVDACGNESTFEQIIHPYSEDVCDDDESDDDEDDDRRVAICHQLGNGNWITIYVAQQAVPAHLAHGDYLGPCTPNTNQWLPYLNLERLPDGTVRKFVRISR